MNENADFKDENSNQKNGILLQIARYSIWNGPLPRIYTFPFDILKSDLNHKIIPKSDLEGMQGWN